jgi:hypothetical protein
MSSICIFIVPFIVLGAGCTSTEERDLPRRRLRKSPPAGGGQVTGWWEQALT